MYRKKELKQYIILNIIILSIIYLSYLCNFRICPIYNLFKIPCPGCGLTTSLNYLLKGKIFESFQYNLMTIPLIVLYSICSIWYVFDLIRNKDSLKKIFVSNKTPIILIAIITFFIIVIRNIINPLLYNN